MKPSLLDILMPPKRLSLVAPPHLVAFKYKFYVGGGGFKGTNDEPIGWNSKRPDWFGFVTKAGNRWYVQRSDLTPESLERALKDLAVKEKARAERSKQCRERNAEIVKARGDAKKQRTESSTLDGREEEIGRLQKSNLSINRMAMSLGVTRKALIRKLEKMEKGCASLDYTASPEQEKTQ